MTQLKSFIELDAIARKIPGLTRRRLLPHEDGGIIVDYIKDGIYFYFELFDSGEIFLTRMSANEPAASFSEYTIDDLGTAVFN